MNRNLLEYAKFVIESLGGVPNLDNPDVFLIKNDLVIRHKETKIEYTVSKVDLTDPKNPILFAYRYTPDGKKRYIDIPKKEFKEYENI